MSVHLVRFPERDVQDVPAGLRRLADEIERGERPASMLAWVADEGDGVIGLGLLGQTTEPGAVMHLLLAAAQKRLLAGIGE